MKKTLVLGLALSLFASIALLADDGNQGGGNLREICSNPSNCPPVCTQGCPMPETALDTENEGTIEVFVEQILIDITKDTLENVLF